MEKEGSINAVIRRKQMSSHNRRCQWKVDGEEAGVWRCWVDGIHLTAQPHVRQVAASSHLVCLWKKLVGYQGPVEAARRQLWEHVPRELSVPCCTSAVFALALARQMRLTRVKGRVQMTASMDGDGAREGVLLRQLQLSLPWRSLCTCQELRLRERLGRKSYRSKIKTEAATAGEPVLGNDPGCKAGAGLTKHSKNEGERYSHHHWANSFGSVRRMGRAVGTLRAGQGSCRQPQPDHAAAGSLSGASRGPAQLEERVWRGREQ